MSARRLFHLAPWAAWREFERSSHGKESAWRPPSLESEGFLHLSFADQLAGTLAAHFGAHDRLALLEVELAPDEPALVLEPSRAGMLFPHLRRPLALHEVARSWELRRSPSSGWNLPDFGPASGRDGPGPDGDGPGPVGDRPREAPGAPRGDA